MHTPERPTQVGQSVQVPGGRVGITTSYFPRLQGYGVQLIGASYPVRYATIELERISFYLSPQR